MGKNSKSKKDVRVHSQEREWLLSLGEGNIVNGVRSLVQQMTEKQSKGHNGHKGKKGKS
jgi:hypothetical protein